MTDVADKAAVSEVVLAIGGNLGDRVATLRQAVRRLAGSGMSITAVSSLYETPPWGYADQPKFLNGAVRGTTALAPLDLLYLAKRIERDLGRTPSFRNGPRPVDLDIALYDDTAIADDAHDLYVPHRSLPERAFVLVPLAEIAPMWQHPTLGRTIAELRAALGPADDVMPYVPASEWWNAGSKSDT